MSDGKPRRAKTHQEKRPRDPEQWTRGPIQRPRKRRLEFRPTPEFFDLADPVVTARHTLLGYDRLYVFWQAIRNVVGVAGHAAEIGTYRGGSAFFIASAFVSLAGDEVPMHVFDTFEGHPQQAITEHDHFQTAGTFRGTNLDDVKALLSPFQQLQIHKGDVIASLPQVAEATYRFVHIDTDLYQPTIACLDYFGARLSPGGVMVIDDYGSKRCPGVPKAVLEYLDRSDAFQVWDMRTEQLMLVKR